MTEQKHFFIGGPVSQTSRQERQAAKERITQVKEFLESIGHTCYCTIPGNPDVSFDEQGRPKIAKKYWDRATKRVVDTVRSFRAGDIAYSVAYWYWTKAELSRADGFIWVLSSASSGSGSEIAWMLRDRKQCLVFFAGKESWTINGIVDRNLITAYWRPEGPGNYEEVLSIFVKKVTEERSQKLNVRLTNDEMKELDRLAESRHESRSDFIRQLIERAAREEER